MNAYSDSKTQGMTYAHKDALELLGVLHGICAENNITYALTGNPLICLANGVTFGKALPNIDVALLYDDYFRLESLISQLPDQRYYLVNAHNAKQFDGVGMRFVKKGRVRLPLARKGDEFYYHSYISILPVFYAGNTKRQANALQKTCSFMLSCINSRKLLKQQYLQVWVKLCVKRAKNAYYLRRRAGCSIGRLIEEMVKHNDSAKFAVCFGPLRQNCATVNAEAFRDVSAAMFEGAGCYIPQDAASVIEALYSRQYTDYIAKMPKSDLLLDGRESLRRVQLIQLEMLVEFDRICRKNGLRYVISFGTLLGAVRHKGFIPWDDDADILMPFDDYKRLDEAMERDMDKEKFYLRTPEKEQDCNITFAHMKRNNTVYAKPGREGFEFHPGVFIDIVPMFNGARTRPGHWIHSKTAAFFRTAMWAYVGYGGVENPLMRRYYRLLARIGNKRAYALFLRFAAIFKKPTGRYAFFNGLNRSPRNCALTDGRLFDDVVELEFEGHNFLAPRNYIDVLKYCYSEDFMLYPPMSCREPKNNAVIDLGGLYPFQDL